MIERYTYIPRVYLCESMQCIFIKQNGHLLDTRLGGIFLDTGRVFELSSSGTLRS
jgi:hypothetical protein